MLVSMSELRENVIRGLECVICPNKFCGDCSYFIRNENDHDTGWCNRDAIYKDALSLLKAQEPIEPIKHLSTGQICGSCKKVLLRKYKYCPACGKAVKWDG